MNEEFMNDEFMGLDFMYKNFKIKCPKCGEEFDATDVINKYESFRQRHEEIVKSMKEANTIKSNLCQIQEKLQNLNKEISESLESFKIQHPEKKECFEKLLNRIECRQEATEKDIQDIEEFLEVEEEIRDELMKESDIL